MTSFGQDHRTEYIRLDGLDLMAFTPINVRPAGLPSAIDHVCGRDLVQNSIYFGLVFHADSCGVDVFALLDEEGCELPSDPAMGSPDEEGVLGGIGMG